MNEEIEIFTFSILLFFGGGERIEKKTVRKKNPMPSN